jgi:DNA-binding transcriptional LysR family regulator
MELGPETAAQGWIYTCASTASPAERNRQPRRVSVDGRVMVNDADLAVRAAADGLGIAYTIEALAEPFLRSGQLVRVLEDWSPTFEDCSCIIPGTVRFRPRCAPSST